MSINNYSEGITKINNLNGQKYKLFGTMNMTDVVPGFVYPVFENNGKYYFQSSKNNMEIDFFYEVHKEKHINMVIPLSSSLDILVNIKEYYTVGDEPLVAFQTSDKNYFIGTSKVFNDFTRNVKIENEELYKRISDLQKEVQLIKLLNRKK